MSDRALPIAVCVLISRQDILLIKRKTGDYQGLWALPGGKIESDEHLKDACIREVREELGIGSTFISFLGIVSEHLIVGGEITGHFLLHVCELKPDQRTVKTGHVGTARWFQLSELESMRDDMVPSDLLMIQHIYQEREGTYYDCVIEKKGELHVLQKFELLSKTQ